MQQHEVEPLLVPGPQAQRMLGVGATKYWSLVKAGAIETVVVGKRRMATVASLRRLAAPSSAKAA